MKVGIIGASFARDAYLPALNLIDGVEVVALASARLESAEAAAKPYSVPHVYDDWRRMLEAHQFDLVCIATPTVTHAAMTLAALDAGAHVLCEKPTAMDVQEAEAMLARATDLGRIHMIDHELRFNPTRRHVKTLLNDDAIGRIRHVVISSIGSSWADPASRPSGDWWSMADQGGGRIGANGSHQIDLLRWWFGEIVAACGQVKTLVPDRVDKRSGLAWTATADDFTQFMLELATGTLVSVLISTVAIHGQRNELTILGDRGTITLSSDTEILMVGRAGEPMREIAVDNPYAGLPGVGTDIWNQGVVGAMREFCGAIMEKRSLREGATFLDGLKNQRVMDAVKLSEAERRWVSIPA
jgi:predicted dehydrogenase